MAVNVEKLRGGEDLLITNYHTNRTASGIIFTSVRVVCLRALSALAFASSPPVGFGFRNSKT